MGIKHAPDRFKIVLSTKSSGIRCHPSKSYAPLLPLHFSRSYDSEPSTFKKNSSSEEQTELYTFSPESTRINGFVLDKKWTEAYQIVPSERGRFPHLFETHHPLSGFVVLLSV